MRKLITYFIKYPIAGNILMIMLILMGYVGITSLRTTFFPEIESKLVQIQAVYPGASPAEIEEGIVLKIEDKLEGLNGIERITSNSFENLGTINVEVNSNYKTDLVLQDIKNAVDGINSFPSGMEPPSVAKFEPAQHAVSVALSGNLSVRELKGIARDWENVLQEDPVISQVEIEGFPDEEIEVKVDEFLLKKYKLTIQDIAMAIKRDNIEITGGELKTPEENILIRVKNKRFNGEDFENIVVSASSNGNLIRLKDVAEVKDGWVDVPNGIWVNNEPSVVVKVYYTINEDLNQIAETVKEYVVKFEQDNPEIKTEVVRDSSKVLRERIDLLVNNGVVGFLLVFLFLSLFLHPRLAIWVAMAIPIAFGGMFIIAGWASISINVISLFGMIIVIGILVDDGIVIAENIYQHWEDGKDPINAAIEGTMEVLPAVFSAILTTVIAFSLFFVLDGVMGDFFVEMGFVVIATLVVSLIEGALILPAHVAHSKALTAEGQKGRVVKVINRFTKALDYVKERFYRPIIDFSLKQAPFVIVATTGFLFIAIATLTNGFQKVSFFPPIYADNFRISLEMASGTNEQITEGYVDEIQSKVWEFNDSLANEGQNVVTTVMKSLGAGSHEASLTVILTPSEERLLTSAQISSAILKKVGKVPNAQKLTAKEGGPFGRPVSVALYSQNNEVLDQFTTRLMEGMNNMGTLKNVESSAQKGMLELSLQLKDKAYAEGLTYQEVITEIRNGFYGYEVQRLQRGLDEVKVWVRYDKKHRNSIGDFENKTVQIKGREFLIKDLVEIEQTRGVVKYEHLDGNRMIKVEADILDVEKSSSSDLLSFVNDSLVNQLLLEYPQVRRSVEGQARESQKVMRSVKSRGWLILLFMFITVVLTFRSFSQAAAVFITSIFGFAGVIWGHMIHGYQMSLFSFFGMIALIGIMVNDALVLISALNVNLKRGMPYIDALKKAATSRFRPILLTSVTTIAGLAPLIFEKSMQAQFLIPMAIAIAYGLIMATFLTLIFLPSILLVFNKWKIVIHWLKTGNVIKEGEQVERAVVELEFEEMLKDK